MTCPKFRRQIFIVCLLSGWDSDPHWFSPHSCHLHSGILPCNFGPWFSPYTIFLFPSARPMGLHGFSVIPKVKGGLFFFQKVLYKLVVGSGNEDSHGNNIKIMLQSLSLQGWGWGAEGRVPRPEIEPWPSGS